MCGQGMPEFRACTLLIVAVPHYCCCVDFGSNGFLVHSVSFGPIFPLEPLQPHRHRTIQLIHSGKYIGTIELALKRESDYISIAGMVDV